MAYTIETLNTEYLGLWLFVHNHPYCNFHNIIVKWGILETVERKFNY